MKFNSFILSILSLSFLWKTLAGTIYTDGAFPISNTISNRQEYADYTFSFRPQSAIPAGAILQVGFPNQFQTGLGLPLAATCNVVCAVSGLNVNFTFAADVAANAFLNPAAKGGTGNFKLTIYKGDSVIDQNLIFGVIGVSDYVPLLASPLVEVTDTFSVLASAVSSYDFSFQITTAIQKDSFFIIDVGTTAFTIAATPACVVFPVNGLTITGTFTCTFSGTQITVTGLEEDLPAGTEMGIRVPMTNPGVSGTTDTFSVYIVKSGTSTYRSKRTGISALTILPGLINSVSFTQAVPSAVLSKGKVMDYVLTFTPTSALISGSVITVTMPTGFEIDTSTLSRCYIISGIEDISGDSRVIVSYDNTTITISNYLPNLTPGAISLSIRAINPLSAGKTQPIVITTYTSSSLASIMDYSASTDTQITILDYENIATNSITQTNSLANGAANTVTFKFQLASSVPLGGKVGILVPSELTVGTVNAASCNYISGSTTTASTACSASGQLISMTLPAALSLGPSHSIQLTGVLTNPTSNGTFSFDITFYDTDGTTVINSYAQFFQLTTTVFPTTPSAVAVRHYNNEAGKLTVIGVTFSVGTNIPTAIPQTAASDVRSFIEVQFIGVGFLADLGTGVSNASVIPCLGVSNLAASAGEDITCRLNYGTSFSPAKIQVSNYLAIASGSTVTLHIPNITNPSSSYQMLIKVVKRENRIWTEYYTQTVSVAIASAATITTSVSGGSAYVFSSYAVGTSTDLSWNANNAAVTPNSASILIRLPTYDIGWIPTYTVASAVTCQIATVAYTCYAYKQVDWILIVLTSGQTVPATSNSWKINGLRVPRYVPGSTPGRMMISASSSAGLELYNLTQSTFPTTFTSPAFTTKTVSASSLVLGDIAVTYTFTFSHPNVIPQGATIWIQFPIAYNLIRGVSQVSFSTTTPTVLTPVGTEITYAVTVNTVRITGFQAIAGGETFTIVGTGITNPSSGSPFSAWNIYVYQTVGNNFASATNFDNTVMTSSFLSGVISFNTFVVQPSNANTTASYTFTIIGATPIPAGGTISITFPSSQYKQLPTPPTCSIAGALTTFQSCVLEGSAFVITLDSLYTPSSVNSLTITIYDVTNPSTVGTSEGFTITTAYAGVTLDTTNTLSTIGRTFKVTNAPGAITVSEINFYPKNEGEAADYIFTFTTTTSLNNMSQIVITFPKVYDQLLGPSITCSSLSGISGQTPCTVRARQVFIQGFSNYLASPSNPISILVRGVINPNQNTNANTGQFKISTSLTTSTSNLDVIESAGALETAGAPGIANMLNLTVDSYYARWFATYTFNLQIFSPLPSSIELGALRIQFPSSYDIISQSPVCKATTSSFGNNLTCTIIRPNVIDLTGQAAQFSGEVVFTVSNINNPVYAGSSGYISVKTYDGFNQVILESTYPNLQPIGYTFTWPGPLVIINDDADITVVRGTRTDPIKITMSYPSALNLTYRPTTTLSLIPFNIGFAQSSIQVFFQISVPNDQNVNTYYIEWSVDGDIIPAYYTPIRKTTVYVVAQTGLMVTIPTLPTVPVGGFSLPIYISLDTAPDLQLIVYLAFDGDSTGLTLSTNLIYFDNGVKRNSFYVNVSDTVAVGFTGTITFTLGGADQSIYQLSADSADFTTAAAITTAPTFSSFVQAAVTMTTVDISVATSEMADVYYRIALKGTAEPTTAELLNLGPARYLSTLSQYGSFRATAAVSTLKITALVAQTDWEVHAIAINQGGHESTIETLAVTTSPRPSAAVIELSFTTAITLYTQLQYIASQIAFVCSLPSHEVLPKQYPVGRRLLIEEELRPKRRMLANQQQFLIAPVDHSEYYLTPVDQGTILNTASFQKLLTKNIQYFDNTVPITSVAFVPYTPGWGTAPTFANSTTDSIVVTFSLDNYGFVYAVFINSTNSSSSTTPTAFQVWRGTDFENVAFMSTYVEISSPNTPFNITLTNLPSNTSWVGYFVGGSTNPGYPDLMDDSNVKSLSVSTLPPPTPNITNTTYGSTLTVSKMFLAIIILIVASLA